MSASLGSPPFPASPGTALGPPPARKTRSCPAPSAMDMWVELVMAVVRADNDIPTLGAWAALAGKSVGSLRLHCYAIHQAPRRALLFARLLRAVSHARGQRWDLGEWLHAADPRTLTKAAQLGGIPETATSAPTVADYLAHQRLLPAECRALDAVRLIVAG